MKKMKKFILTFFVAIYTFGMVGMAQNLNSPINNDPNVKIGKLDNGLTYYIRENKKPENRVELRLAVNAGSNQENDDQQGLAHFTEHMAFNGIKGFPGNKVISELQKIGVSFGGGINAYTSFDETVYMIQMPTENKKHVDMGLNILKGWASGLLFNAKEIESERGVIAEEYRMGLGASDRMRKVWWPVLFKDSRYAERMPIGLIEIINGFEHQTIKDFYKDWYRTDLQAVIVVGDINAEEIEKMIIKKFSSIKPVKNPREKLIYPIKENKEPLVSICTDKEAMGTQVMLVRKHPHNVMKTVADYRNYMATELYNIMYESRLTELQQEPNCPFIQAFTGYGDFIGNTDAYVSQAACKENKINETIETLIREDYRVLNHGFLESELKRAKEDLLNRYEIAAKEVNKTESARFANEYVAHYLHKDPIPGAKRELSYAQKYLEDITIDEINALAKEWITDENRVAIIMAPDKEELIMPTEQEVLSIMNDKELANVSPYIDTYKEQEIVEKESLQPGTIVNTKMLDEIGAKELTLSNGIKVITKKTDYKNDEILFSARSRGGYSLYEEADLASAMFAADLIDRAGIGELNLSSLLKKMKGKKVGVTPYISALEEGLSGSSTPKDLDFFFQYINAFFSAPRYDTAVYHLVINETIEQLKMIKAAPMYQFFGEFFGEITQHDPYQHSILTYSDEFINTANYERAYNLYKERFANPADFTFIFVGNFDEEIMNELLTTYIASLPTTSKTEEFRGEIIKGFPDKQVDKDYFAGMEEQSWVGITYNKEYPWNAKNNMIIDQIGEALQIELIETIREKMSGVYSPMLQMGCEKYPTSTYTLLVMFSCSPDNTTKLSDAVFNILKTFQQQGPKAETLAKVKEQMILQHQNDYQKNEKWLSYISGLYYNQEENWLDHVNTYKQRVNEITNKDIVNFMNQYFDINHFVKMELYPEAMKN
jgi:zinc protease